MGCPPSQIWGRPPSPPYMYVFAHVSTTLPLQLFAAHTHTQTHTHIHTHTHTRGRSRDVVNALTLNLHSNICLTFCIDVVLCRHTTTAAGGRRSWCDGEPCPFGPRPTEGPDDSFIDYIIGSGNGVCLHLLDKLLRH